MYVYYRCTYLLSILYVTVTVTVLNVTITTSVYTKQ
jgi:hypothetical protein